MHGLNMSFLLQSRRLSSVYHRRAKKHCKLAGMGRYESSHSSSNSSFSSASKVVDGSDAECKSIYKKLAMIFHPDKFKGSDEIFKSMSIFSAQPSASHYIDQLVFWDNL